MQNYKFHFYIVFTLVTMILFAFPLFSQSINQDTIKIHKNNVYFELGGVAEFGSVNYERLLLQKSKNKMLFRIGILYLPMRDGGKQVFGLAYLPFGFYYLFGTKNNLEVGINNAIAFQNNNVSNIHKTYYIVSPSIGYRYNNILRKSCIFNVAFSPIFLKDQTNLNRGVYCLPWFKIGVGLCF